MIVDLRFLEHRLMEDVIEHGLKCFRVWTRSPGSQAQLRTWVDRPKWRRSTVSTSSTYSRWVFLSLKGIPSHCLVPHLKHDLTQFAHQQRECDIPGPTWFQALQLVSYLWNRSSVSCSSPISTKPTTTTWIQLRSKLGIRSSDRTT